MSKQKQNIVEGGVILTLAVVVVKIVGAVYKIPTFGLIGEDGVGFYYTAYNLYLTVYSLAVTGFPVAVSKIVAGFAAEGRFKDVRKLVKVSRWAFGILGVISSIVLALLARPYVNAIDNPRSYYCVLMVAPSLLFSCLMSVQRGYNQGMQNMVPTAVSQVIEVLFKAGAGFGLAYIAKSRLSAEFAASGTVFGEVCADAATADVAISAVTAAAVILGVSISTFAGWAYLAIRRAFKGDGIHAADIINSPRAHSAGYLLKQIGIFVLPIAISSVTVNITGLIDNASILERLRGVVEGNLATLYASHGGWLEQAEKAPADLPNYLYGVYNSAISIFNLVPSLTGSFGMSALPHVTAAWQLKNRAAVTEGMESTLRLTTLIAAPAGFGIAFLAGPIAQLLYGNSMPVGSHMMGTILTILGIAAIFVAIVSPLNALLQAVGRIDVPVKLMVVGGLIKLASNYFLVAVPSLNIKAAPAGNLLCYLVIFILSIIIVQKTAGIKLDIKGTLIKPLFAGLMCGVFALLAYNVFTRLLPSISAKIVTVAAIGVGALVYVIVLGVTKALAREDVRSFPGGRKLEVLLEKVHMLR